MNLQSQIDFLNASLTNTSTTTANLLNLTSIRSAKLQDIFVSSGCQKQACDYLTQLIPPSRNSSDKSGDVIVIKMMSIKYDFVWGHSNITQHSGQELGGGVDKVSQEQFCMVQSLILMHLHNSKEHA